MENVIGSLDFRTDLAIECHECYENTEVDGVKVTNCFYENKDISKTKVEISSELGAKMLGKPIGNYITIESQKLKDGNVNIHNTVIELVIESLEELCDFENVKNILVVGLGNLYVTPDSLGQKVVQKLLITRHFFDELSQEYSGIRNLSALSPGVMGQTGIETSTIVKTVAKEINADLVIAIDALCARNVNRLNQTIQISDTGISPGAGVNNKRQSINEEYIGAKVIAIGVPTVIDAQMLFKDALEQAFYEPDSSLNDFKLSNDLKDNIIHEVLDLQTFNMFVSPKEIDELIVRLSGIISRGLNRAIHNGITDEDITSLLY